MKIILFSPIMFCLSITFSSSIQESNQCSNSSIAGFVDYGRMPVPYTCKSGEVTVSYGSYCVTTTQGECTPNPCFGLSEDER